MKRSSILALSALVIALSACEKHPASQLPPELLGEGHGAGKKHEATSAEVHPPAPKHEEAKPAAEAKPGEAPKFFPENK